MKVRPGIMKLILLIPFLSLVLLLQGCSGGKTLMNAYVLKDANLGGDAARGIRPVKSIMVWPLLNNAPSAKAKGVEIKLTDIFIDQFYLRGQFDTIGIITGARAKELLARAGEELGLKRKPKEIDGGLVATKIGELEGGDAFFIGILNDYDEEKVDKVVFTHTGGTFFLIDAREEAYPNLDSFTPVKFLWRTNVKQTSKETLITGRKDLDSTVRKMAGAIVERLVSDLSGAQGAERARLNQEISSLKGEAASHLKNEEFDKATAAWNEILRLDPGNDTATDRIEEIQKRKLEAEERKKAEALKEEIEGLKKEAKDLEKAGDLDGAIAKWEEVLAKDESEKEAIKRVEKLKSRRAEEAERAMQKEISKELYNAQKNLGEEKYQAAIDAANKVLEMDPENEKAKAVISDANLMLEELKAKEAEGAASAVEEKAEPAPVEEKIEAAPEPAPAPEPTPVVEEKPKEAPPAKKPAAVEESAAGESPESAEIRQKAMEYFDREEYEKSRDEWKRLLELMPDDEQAREMLDTVEMLIQALQ